MLIDFVREPTTYVVVAAEQMDHSPSEDDKEDYPRQEYNPDKSKAVASETKGDVSAEKKATCASENMPMGSSALSRSALSQDGVESYQSLKPTPPRAWDDL